MKSLAKANPKQLTVKQLNAIDLLLLGKTTQEVAEAVGVTRSTISMWLNRNPYFQQELERKRQEVWGSALDRMRSLTFKALDVIENSLNRGEVKTALKFLELVKNLEPPAQQREEVTPIPAFEECFEEMEKMGIY
ncbi:helix-turn-helix domain-containing protein [Atrimonas thermophila]|uniref:helix-turn-helix domain-containing protein n=1 Tax=Atrimonas thermophila TaxID=3064161 RepID=UPI00399CDD88